ncbi:MAG TPA: AraC family transcriptional regulator [Vicinamibacterales bacterium]|jgi:AraC-like DNA-binding protein|nr:AraC family transcriptional regulator [Vicinamibacterales bacterium]
MDALSEILRVIRLDSAVYINAELSAPCCLATPHSRLLAPILARRGGHVIIYHLIRDGRAYVQLEGEERVMLSAGDVGERSRLICGFLSCDPQLGQAFLGGLPRVIKINIREEPSGHWLENSLEFSVTQAARREADGDAMLAKLSEAVFAETLRRYVRRLPQDDTGWLAGARDPDVGRALTLIHQRAADPWTISGLAKEIGLSRTVLTERFRHFLGVPPMTYLTRWRLRLGARALTTTRRGVAQIAVETGYESEAAFNRAFKREYGLPPARYRRDKAGAHAPVATLTVEGGR